jgi:hypothetical protein
MRWRWINLTACEVLPIGMFSALDDSGAETQGPSTVLGMTVRGKLSGASNFKCEAECPRYTGKVKKAKNGFCGKSCQ